MPFLLPRIRFFEIEDQWWLPPAIRRCVQNHLAVAWKTSIPGVADLSPAEHAGDVLLANLPDPENFTYVDACAGGGGPTPTVERRVNGKLAAEGWKPAKFVLTDLHPNVNAWDAISKRNENIGYIAESVDATKAGGLAEEGKKECRMFSLSFHHLDDPTAAQVLRKCVESADAFVIFELPHRDAGSMMSILLGFLAAMVMPLIQFRNDWVHMVFTYLIPVVPFVATFDGLVSGLRARTPDEIKAMLRVQQGLDLSQWDFKDGQVMVLPPLGRLHWFMGVKAVQ